MERWTKKAVELGTRLAILGDSSPSVTEYKPSKTEIVPCAVGRLERVSPESVGVSGGRIAAMLKELESDKSLNLHNVLVVRDNRIISSASRPGYSRDVPHLSHSMSKVLVSIAIGYLVEDGVLNIDDRVVDILPEYIPKDKRFASITVHHLLSMTSGVKFSEVGVVTESKWTECFFNSGMKFEPGKEFAYNSMNTYMLAVIAKRVSGTGVADILKTRLLTPLGIEDFFWEKSHEGIEKGGFGVYMSAESWAKIACVFLNKGIYGESLVIPKTWIDTITSVHASAPLEKGGYDYGYAVWTSLDGESCLFSGMLGQNVFISFKNNIAIVINSGNDELFFSGNTLYIVEKYFSEKLPGLDEDEYRELDTALRECEEKFMRDGGFVQALLPKRGILHRIGLRYREPYPDGWNRLIGRFSFPMNNMSILPMFVRVMQNNFPSSIEEIGFVRDGRRIFLTCRDGGVSYKMEVGFYRYAESEIEVGGERYRVRILGGITREDGDTEYRLDIVYPELPNSRRISITLSGRDTVSVRFTELPGLGLIDAYLDEVLSADPRMRFVTDMLESRLGRRYLHKRSVALFDRTFVGVRRGSINYPELMDKARDAAPRPTSEERAVASLILRFVNTSDKAEGGILGDILGLFGFRS